MPNWNNNKVTIHATEAMVREYLTEDGGKLYFNMHRLFPERFEATDPAGQAGWDYDWACANTLSKRFPEIYDLTVESKSRVVLCYDTAWSPNNGTLQRFHEQT